MVLPNPGLGKLLSGIILGYTREASGESLTVSQSSLFKTIAVNTNTKNQPQMRKTNKKVNVKGVLFPVKHKSHFSKIVVRQKTTSKVFN